MPNTPSHVIIAGLGPFAELLGVFVLVALFTLLRGQADRRPYFKAWEESWVMLAVGLLAGVIYQRLTDPTSVLYPGTAFSTWLFAFGYLAFKFLAFASLIAGVHLFTTGDRNRLLIKAAVPTALALALIADTRDGLIGSLNLYHGPVAVITYAFAAVLVTRLPDSRHSLGSRIAQLVLITLTAFWAALIAFDLAARLQSGVAAMPWFVRTERYAFFLDLALQLALGYAMVRLLFEDAKREADDTRAQLTLLQDRERLADLYDVPTSLLNHRAYDAAVGLDFAKASFGSVLLVRMDNAGGVLGASDAEAMFVDFAKMLDSAVRSHDRVFRWSEREFLVVMPRATPDVAQARMQFLVARAAPFTVAGKRESVRAGAALSVAAFTGAEDLGAAVRTLAPNRPS
jgi:GGDEF domain-containing protein